MSARLFRMLIVVVAGVVLASSGRLSAQVCRTSKTASAQQIKDADNLLIKNTDTATISNAVSKHLPWGIPVTTGTTHEHFLFQKDYVIDYDDDLRVPIWEAHTIRAEDLRIKRTRTEAFRRDPRLNDTVASVCEDYSHSGYDRGHMAPSGDFPQTLSSMLNSYTLSNMTPQKGELNRGFWQQFESLVRKWGQNYGQVWVITGAIFDKNGDSKRDADADVDKVKGRVGIPTAYYKIIVRQPGPRRIQAIAAIMPQNDDDRENVEFDEYLASKLVSIDEIESVTGIDFFPQMPKRQQNVVEKSKRTSSWE